MTRLCPRFSTCTLLIQKKLTAGFASTVRPLTMWVLADQEMQSYSSNTDKQLICEHEKRTSARWDQWSCCQKHSSQDNILSPGFCNRWCRNALPPKKTASPNSWINQSHMSCQLAPPQMSFLMKSPNRQLCNRLKRVSTVPKHADSLITYYSFRHI